jgi:hypothetical protein
MSSLENLLRFLEDNFPVKEQKVTDAIQKIRLSVGNSKNSNLELVSQKLLDFNKQIFNKNNNLNPIANPLGQMQIYSILAFLSESISGCENEIKILNDIFTEKLAKINSVFN